MVGLNKADQGVEGLVDTHMVEVSRVRVVVRGGGGLSMWVQSL